MEYNYNNLWKLLIDKKLMKKDLMEKNRHHIIYHRQDGEKQSSEYGGSRQNMYSFGL